MGDLSKNFSRSEFACRGEKCCGGSAPIDDKLVQALQKLRDKLGKPIRITSGFRCVRHNTTIRGSKSSEHMLGKAADITVCGVAPCDVAAKAEEVEAFMMGGIGVYGGWVHLDVRDSGPARWEG